MIKYHDLPWNLKRQIDASGPRMQPSASQNPTVKNILNRLYKAEQRSIDAGANVSAQQKRKMINTIKEYLGNCAT